MQQPQRPQPQEWDPPSSSYSSHPRSTSSVPVARVVDIDAIELEKENIQPIRQGRSATLLARLFSTQPGERAHELALQHQRFQEELEQIDELDDPLDVFARYVNWTIESYPQGSAQGHESHLMDLLEKAIKSLKDEQRYMNDLRFVRLYILYAEKVEYPLEIYKFMEKHDIGTGLSLYYEAYAEYLETRDELDKAREILLLGIHRRAQPLKRLQRNHEEFLLREQRRKEELEKEAIGGQTTDQASVRNHPSNTHSSTTGSNVNRRVLGDRVSASESIHPNSAAARRAPAGLGISSSSSTADTSSNQRSNSKLTVFSDSNPLPSAHATRTPKSAQRVQTPQVSQGNEHRRDPGSELVRRKENVREATPWKGVKLASGDSHAKKQQPKLEVYRDVEVSAKQPSSALLLIRKGYTARSTPKINTAAYAPITPNNKGSAKINERGKRERVMTNLEQIYLNNFEFSIEEIRAKQPRYKRPVSLNKPSKPPAPQPLVSHQRPRPLPQLPLPDSTPHAVAPQPVRPVLPTNDSDNERQGHGPKRRLTSSPTLHTKFASEEMNKIFSDRTRARMSMESQWDTDENQDEDDTRNYTGRISLPNLQLDPSSRAFLENEIQSEFDNDDEHDGQTDVFLRRLERGFASTITQDIEAMKKRRLEEGDFGHTGETLPNNVRLSLRSNKRGSFSRFDPNHTYDLSDITIAIRQRTLQNQQELTAPEVPRSSIEQGRRVSRSSYATDTHRSSVRQSIQPSSSSASSTRPRAFKVFHDESDNLDVDGVPMLEDEAPPACLHHDEPF
ncbi:hypothetical protein BGX34_010312 [Mortierella sp. NVP85]|nr:hypothetical protein BGX34_010312 [Mortierella sp. NVP85]